MKPFVHVQTGDLQAALKAGAKGSHFKAGGVDLIDRLKERVEAPDRLTSVVGISALRGIRPTASSLSIGAACTLSEVAASADVGRALSVVAHAAGEAATPQIRNMATVGGNLLQRPRCAYWRSRHFHCLKKGGATCFAVEGEHDTHAVFGGGPCHIVHPSNLAPALVAVSAKLVLEHARNGRRSIAAEAFFVGPQKRLDGENLLAPGELLTEVRVDALPAASGYAEVRHKQSFDWPLATAAVARFGTTWRVVLGAVAPTPWRAVGAEAILNQAGQAPDEGAIAKAAEAAVRGAKPLPRAAWRLELVKTVVRRAVVAARGAKP